MENANKRGPSRNASVNAGPWNRITELNNTALVDLVRLAARNMTIGADVVRYVNTVEEAFAGDSRRQAENDAGSSEAPTLTRIRLGDLIGTQPGPSRALVGGPAPALASVSNRPGRPRPFSRRPMKPIRPIGWPIGLRHFWGFPYPSDIRLTA